MIILETSEGTFKYIDLVELIREYDKNTSDMYVPSDEAMVFKVKGSFTIIVGEEFSELIKELKRYYELIMETVPKRLFMELGYYRLRE